MVLSYDEHILINHLNVGKYLTSHILPGTYLYQDYEFLIYPDTVLPKDSNIPGAGTPSSVLVDNPEADHLIAELNKYYRRPRAIRGIIVSENTKL